MPEIVLKNVTKRWGKFYAVDHLNLHIDDNSFITLLGPSGCGKTTILRMIFISISIGTFVISMSGPIAVPQLLLL